MTSTPAPIYRRIEGGGIHEIAQIERAVEELKRKAPMVEAGICSFSEADIFAYRVLASSGFFGDINAARQTADS
jgi:hypothetical protein